MFLNIELRCTTLYAAEQNFSTIGDRISRHSTTLTRTPTPTPTPTSSRGSSRECRRIVQHAIRITSGIARVGRVGEDPREDVRVGVGVVEFQL